MATIYRCDGCDTETRAKSDFSQATISSQPQIRGTEGVTIVFDLCDTCYRKFMGDLPNNWPRGESRGFASRMP